MPCLNKVRNENVQNEFLQRITIDMIYGRRRDIVQLVNSAGGSVYGTFFNINQYLYIIGVNVI